MNHATPKSLHFAFDVGHSSLGWAVLQTHIGHAPKLLGSGVVTFPKEDCAALDRRGKRRQRRNIRARKQRILRMETLLAGIGAIPHEELKRQHAQGKGNVENGGAGFSYPWLHAARILAVSPSERHKYLLTWPQLWDVLRWYAHNRGYDGNLRWSGGYRADGFSEENKLEAAAFESLVKRDLVPAGNEEEGGETPEKGEAGKDEDLGKLKMGEDIMRAYGFATPTFAESIAKFLLGPDRVVKPPKQPGQAGQLEKTSEAFTREDFHRKLFGLDEEFREHPKHLRNYFKGLMAAFPRRHIDPANNFLAGGVEWEVRAILRAHRDAPADKARCDETFETVICGGLPERPNDWKSLEAQHPQLYLSMRDVEAIKALRSFARDSDEERERKMEARKQLRVGKLVLPSRYQGGLLFGQLVPRFENRIIAECSITYARKLPMLLRVIGGQEAYESSEIWSDEDRAQIDSELAHFRKKLAKTESDHRKLAEEYAADLAKVPAKSSLAFLDYRWAMLLANIKIRKPGETYPGKEKLRPLTAEERAQIDIKTRAKGFLEYQRKDAKKGHEEINELADIVRDVTGCAIEDTNLDGFFIPPDMREALKLVPIEKGEKAFRHVWQHLDDKLRRRFTIQLLRGQEPKELKPSDVCRQLRKIGRAEVAEAIEAGANARLLDTPFRGQKLEGRARYHHDVLRQVWCEVMRCEDPRKKIQDEIFLPTPKERHGCLVLTEDMQTRLDEKPLASQTNNHLVRHRILILAGDREAKPKPMDGLLDDLLAEFADGDIRKIGRVTIEVARDLQEMSGKSNQDKRDIEFSKRAEHDHAAEKLAAIFANERSNGKPIKINAGLIKKARIGDDLGWNKESRSWQCPYTDQKLEPRWLVLPKNDRCRIEKDHIIPQSQRLSHAIEAQVLTFASVNRWKDNRTAFEFIKEFGGQPVPGLNGVNLRTVEQFRAFVQSLPVKGPSKADVMRKKKRKELLLTEHWSGDGFTPGDLTKTSHIIKLAAQKLCARFRELPEDQRPEVVYIPGSVTHAFRDKQWRLFRELGAVHPGVKAEMEKGDDRFVLRYSGDRFTERSANKKRLYALGKKVKKALTSSTGTPLSEGEMKAADIALREALDAVGEPRLIDLIYWGKTTLNLKQAIRGITHLHHAVDAIAIGIVSAVLVPPRATGMHDTIARGIVKERLNADERREFEAIRNQLQLPKFYRWAKTRCDDPNRAHPAAGEGGTLCLDELSPETKKQIVAELKYAREHRVIQHIPKATRGLPAQLNPWRVVPPIVGTSVTLRQQERQDDGTIKKKEEQKELAKLIGISPKGGKGKLLDQQAALVLGENFGIAILDHALAPEPVQKKRGAPVPAVALAIVPFRNVRQELKSLAARNGNHPLRLLRKGTLIHVPNGKCVGYWRVLSPKNTEAYGLVVDIAAADGIEMIWGNQPIPQLIRDGLRVIEDPPLCGIAPEQTED